MYCMFIGYAELNLSTHVTSSHLFHSFVTSTDFIPSTFPVALIIKELSLNIYGGTVLEDNIYRFGLEVVSEGSQLTKTYINVHTAISPSLGALEVRNMNATHHVAKIIATGWKIC